MGEGQGVRVSGWLTELPNRHTVDISTLQGMNNCLYCIKYN
jgi:hypothetical protein